MALGPLIEIGVPGPRKKKIYWGSLGAGNILGPWAPPIQGGPWVSAARVGRLKGRAGYIDRYADKSFDKLRTYF